MSTVIPASTWPLLGSHFSPTLSALTHQCRKKTKVETVRNCDEKCRNICLKGWHLAQMVGVTPTLPLKLYLALLTYIFYKRVCHILAHLEITVYALRDLNHC